jgi:hypothetical protein
MDPTPINVLIRTREILNHPLSWTRGVNAVNASNHVVGVASPSACRWCLRGAMKRACHDLLTANSRSGLVSRIDRLALYEDTLRLIGISNAAIISYNDTKGRTHKQITNRLDRWITAHAP